MSGSIKVIISDSTPLIAFSRINQFELLHTVIGKIIIPKEVAREISEYGKGKNKIINISDYNWIEIKNITSKNEMELLLPSIDKGEAEVIILALENKADLVLMDELSGRKIAESFNLNILGSVGVLLKAKEKGLIKAVKPLLDEMIEKGIRYSQRFYTHLLKQIGEI